LSAVSIPIPEFGGGPCTRRLRDAYSDFGAAQIVVDCVKVTVPYDGRLAGAVGIRLKARLKIRKLFMISFGFSARHWQQIEADRPITMTTLLRICDVFKVRLEEVVRGLDRGIYHD
jgi:hypothetical protein